MRRLCALLLAVAMLSPSPLWAAAGTCTDTRVGGNTVRFCTMLEAVVATDDGVWVDFRGFTLATLQVDGITTAELEVYASNDETRPANNVDGVQVGSDITADGMTTIVGPYSWLKVKVADWTSGTITALLVAATQGGGGSSTAASGAVTITTDPVPVQGKKTNNDAAPGATNVGTLGAVATAAQPSYTEGNLVAPSTNLTGLTRVYVPDSGETNHTKLTTASTNARSLTSTETILTAVVCFNPNTSSTAYLHLYNLNTTPTPASDSADKVATYDIGASPGTGQRGGVRDDIPLGMGGFTDGLAYTITGNKVDTDTTVAPADVRCNIRYHGKQS